MYSIHTAPTEKKVEKEEKEARMTSVHGSKTFLATAGICLISISLLLGGVISEKKSKIKLYEKKYSSELSALETNNRQFTVGGLPVEADF